MNTNTAPMLQEISFSLYFDVHLCKPVGGVQSTKEKHLIDYNQFFCISHMLKTLRQAVSSTPLILHEVNLTKEGIHYLHSVSTNVTLNHFRKELIVTQVDLFRHPLSALLTE
ncbi:hypothetical protein NPIL_447361 [Nephila pilipes]|uniref:Uncharacterized protein n=1 Tax=Nephila pilipes TaxID=299642 RepID=A0A8X6P2E0_NEPPI|nr:hypothetical protein NPIL_447361 [Nephila pilipes]